MKTLDEHVMAAWLAIHDAQRAVLGAMPPAIAAYDQRTLDALYATQRLLVEALEKVEG